MTDCTYGRKLDAGAASEPDHLLGSSAANQLLRHDLRGILTAALLAADKLLLHSDPKVVRAGEIVVSAVTQAEKRMAGI